MSWGRKPDAMISRDTDYLHVHSVNFQRPRTKSEERKGLER